MASAPSAPSKPSLALVVLALATLYLIWGSTYLAMRIALEAFPPFLMAGPRFLVAGGVLYAVARLRGAPRPRAAEWLACAKVGIMLLTLGNGAVSIAEQSVSSSVAAIVLGLTPICAAVFGRLIGESTTGREWLGLMLGFAGVVLLNAGGQLELHARGLILLAAPMTWGVGSAWSRRLPLPEGPIATAMQMLTAGGSLLVLALVTGEHLPASISGRAFGALVYLIVFGSLVGFTAYAWLLANVRPTLAMSYAYVNPLVAVLLGWAFGGEAVTPSMLAAAAVSLTGVAILRR